MTEDFPHLTQEKSTAKGQHRTIMMFKGRLRGIHHSVEHLQAYIDEYTYQFNKQKMKEGIFDNLITKMIYAKHCT